MRVSSGGVIAITLSRKQTRHVQRPSRHGRLGIGEFADPKNCRLIRR
jgi:hypothetical protein